VLLYAAAKGRWAKAHTLSYDAARKSVEALLLMRGWRVTSWRSWTWTRAMTSSRPR
jgi:hypothetical protein